MIMTPKILVVDDEPDLEILVKQKFRKQIKEGKYNFYFAGNGVQALEKLDNDKEIELVLTDINMPEMDGLTLLKKIKEKSNPLLLSVIVSAYGDILNIRTAMNGGAFDFVVKPIDLNDMEITINKALDNLATLKKALKARDELVVVQKELNAARELQLSMLPKELPKTENYEVAFHMRTASEVGGDYYDYTEHEDGSLSVVIGDATGHGMSAGTMVSVMKGLFTAKASDASLERFFYNSNRTIKHINLKRMMMAFSMITMEDDKLYYLNAGMPPLYIYKKQKNKVLEIDSHNMPLGAINESKFSARELEIESGDVILLLSDGYPEHQNSEGKLYGYEQLIIDFQECAEGPPQNIIEKLNEKAVEWSNGKENEDDITFAVIKVK